MDVPARCHIFLSITLEGEWCEWIQAARFPLTCTPNSWLLGNLDVKMDMSMRLVRNV